MAVRRLLGVALVAAGVVATSALPASAHFLSAGNGCKVGAIGTMWVQGGHAADRNGDHVVCIHLASDGSIEFRDNNFNPQGNPPAWGRTG